MPFYLRAIPVLSLTVIPGLPPTVIPGLTGNLVSHHDNFSSCDLLL